MAQTNGSAQNGKAPAAIKARDGRKPENIKQLIEEPWVKDRMRALVPKHMNPERLLRISALAIHNTPNLVKCNPMSLLGSIMKCGQLGQEPNTPLQHVYLVPYKKKKKTPDGWVEEYDVEVIIGYRGYIDLARRSGMAVTIHGDVIYQADDYDYEYGSNARLFHKPRLTELNGEGLKVPVENRGPIIAGYAHCKLTGGEAFKVLPLQKLLEIRDGSQGYQTALRAKENAKGKYLPKAWTKCPWVAHEPAMYAKSGIRHLSNELPLSVDFAGALSIDGAGIDYGSMANASDSEIVDLDPSAWKYDGEEEDDDGGEDELRSQPAGDDGPAQIQQSAEPTIDTSALAEGEAVNAETGEVTSEGTKPKAAAARNSSKKSSGSTGLFQE